jgi:hypothetical protein
MIVGPWIATQIKDYARCRGEANDNRIDICPCCSRKVNVVYAVIEKFDCRIQWIFDYTSANSWNRYVVFVAIVTQPQSKPGGERSFGESS